MGSSYAAAAPSTLFETIPEPALTQDRVLLPHRLDSSDEIRVTNKGEDQG